MLSNAHDILYLLTSMVIISKRANKRRSVSRVIANHWEKGGTIDNGI